MTFRSKILLSIYGVVLGFLLITFLVVNYWARNRIENTFADELRTSTATLNVLLRQQAELLHRACMVIAESPRLKAVTELRDPETAFQATLEITQTSLNDFFLLTDDGGKPLVHILLGERRPWPVDSRQIQRRAGRESFIPELWFVRNGLYKVSTVSVMGGDRMQGTLTIGFRYTDSDLQTLQQAVNSDMALVLDSVIMFSTLDEAERLDVETMLRSGDGIPEGSNQPEHTEVFEFSGVKDTYLAASYALSRSTPGDTARVRYLIMKPVGEAVAAAMQPIFGIFAIVSVVFLVITFAVGTVIARGISRPVRELVTGAAEIGRGNYDHAIRVTGRDEMSLLAQQFSAMSESLRDKMSQLDALNRDLTARNEALDDALRKLQDAQQEIVRSERLAATGKLTAQLAHEINNPIHNIQSCIKTALARLPGDAKGRDLITVAFEEIGRLSKLTRQMLDFYRGSVLELERELVDVNGILREVAATFSPELEQRGITCVLDLQDALPPVLGSRDKLLQVFLNLVLNARDAMPQGGTISIRTRVDTDNIRIQFTDTGVGIPAENLSRIFDAFYTTKSKVSGVGLGLSVSYGIVGQHGGTIGAMSEPGKGTLFTVVLPAAEHASTP